MISITCILVMCITVLIYSSSVSSLRSDKLAGLKKSFQRQRAKSELLQKNVLTKGEEARARAATALTTPPKVTTTTTKPIKKSPFEMMQQDLMAKLQRERSKANLKEEQEEEEKRQQADGKMEITMNQVMKDLEKVKNINKDTQIRYGGEEESGEKMSMADAMRGIDDRVIEDALYEKAHCNAGRNKAKIQSKMKQLYEQNQENFEGYNNRKKPL